MGESQQRRATLLGTRVTPRPEGDFDELINRTKEACQVVLDLREMGNEELASKHF